MPPPVEEQGQLGRHARGKGTVAPAGQIGTGGEQRLYQPLPDPGLQRLGPGSEGLSLLNPTAAKRLLASAARAGHGPRRRQRTTHCGRSRSAIAATLTGGNRGRDRHRVPSVVAPPSRNHLRLAIVAGQRMPRESLGQGRLAGRAPLHRSRGPPVRRYRSRRRGRLSVRRQSKL